MNKRKNGFIEISTLIIILAVIYIVSLLLSFQGWGYPGHDGHHYHHSSWFYWGGPRTYSDMSAREQSVGGSHFSEGGLKPGK